MPACRRCAACHLALLAALCLPGYGFAQEETVQKPSPPDRDRTIYQESDQPLDARIKPEKITEQDPPPLPQRVILPMPPVFRIATEPAQVPMDVTTWQSARDAIEKGLAYLRTAQDASGGWMTHIEAAPTDEPQKPSPIAVAVTALAIKAFRQAETEPPTSASVPKAIRFVRSARNADGSFEGGALSNYVTSAVVSALAAADRDAFHDDIEAAVVWLQRTQWDQGEGLSPRQDWFGGAGYGNRGRPDLSNTQMMLEALYDSGMSPDEPAFQRAQAFLTRAQNLKATNRAPWAGDDGGFIYTPANGGESFASQAAGEGRYGETMPPGQARSLRSYGSMTYAGFKSMLYAGLSPDDVRVRAAFDWVRRHWGFDENPGLGQQGLYYYYHTMARALTVAQQHQITDIDGTSHNWRNEMARAIIERQRDDGSWKNSADRWLEAEPVMATVFAVLSLEEVLKPVLAVQ